MSLNAKKSPENWVDLYGDYLFCYASTLMPENDPNAIEEVVQDTFLAALKADFSGKSTEKTWLTRILRNKIADFYRKHNRALSCVEDKPQRNLFFNIIGNWNPKMVPNKWEDPHKELERQEFWDVFQKCEKKLPKNFSQIFSLSALKEVTHEEICEIFQISSNNLWTILHRTRLRIRECLQRNWFDKEL